MMQWPAGWERSARLQNDCRQALVTHFIGLMIPKLRENVIRVMMN